MKKQKKEIRDKLNISENNEIPAIKIGRFAIDKKYSKKGLGSHILSNVLLSLLNLSKNKIGFRFVLVEACAIALDFYIKNNFYTLESDEEALEKIDKIKKHNPKQCFNIYLDLKDTYIFFTLIFLLEFYKFFLYLCLRYFQFNLYFIVNKLNINFLLSWKFFLKVYCC